MPLTVVVLVKHVPDAQEPRALAGSEPRLHRDPEAGLLSELDEYAVEAALRLVEEHGGTVTALTVGPPGAARAVRSALQSGADAGVHVVDPALAGSDVLGTARVLAAAVTRLAPDVVVTGMASTDAATGLVPAALAQLLGMPLLGLADRVEAVGDPARLRVERDAGAEVVVLEAGMPAVLSVTDRIGEPRYPSFRTIMAAKKKEITAWAAADLGERPAGGPVARTRVLTATALPARVAERRMVRADAAAVAVADLLAELELL